MDPDPKEELKRRLQILLQAVGEGALNEVKDVINWFHQDLVGNKRLVTELYASGSRCVTQHDVIINACLNKQADILYYLLKETHFLDYLIDPDVSETEVHNQRTKAIQHALCSNSFCMVEMLYDYWCGDLYWVGHDIQKLETLEKLLEDARVVCLVRDQQLLINYHCLVVFNRFQQTVYKSLPRQNPIDMTSKELASAILDVLVIHDRYSDLEMVRIPHDSYEDELEKKENFEDRSSIYYKGFANIMYEVYFRKMDFNVSLLILENLHLLREFLIERFKKKENYFAANPVIETSYKNAAELYKQIESAIYHFIYRTREDWRLYLPKDRLITIEKHHVGLHKGHLIRNLKLSYDSHKLVNAPVIYLERKIFKKYFKKFKRILKRHIIKQDPAIASTRQDSSKTIHILDKNYLKPVMYMSDHYSLRKIIDYIEAIENTQDVNVLMIFRALQVIGEMTKNTKDSYHISESTKALLQVVISVETTNHMHNIREFVSHAREGQLTTRIDSEDEHKQTFDDIVKDLIEIKKNIISVLEIYKSILDKSLLEKGLSLLRNRILQYPVDAAQNLQTIQTLYKIHKGALFLPTNDFVQQVWNHTGLTVQLLREIPWILNNRDEILLKIQKTKTLMELNLVNILPTSIKRIRHTLQLIAENNNNVILVNKQLAKYNINKLSVYPNMGSIKLIRECKTTNLRKKNKQANDDLQLLDDLKDYSTHWKSIKNMLSFCLDDCELFASIRLRLSEASLPDNLNLSKAHKIIEEMEAVCLMHTSTLAWISGRRLALWGLWTYELCKKLLGFKSDPNPSFSGIETVDNINTSNHKIAQANLAPRRDYQYWKTSQEKLILCLINRVKLLQDVLEYPQVIADSQHLRRYKRDHKFRMELEMLLADIGNILVQCHNNLRIMKKSTKLFRGIDLGNVLDHGNPFLEVIGGVFDSYELPKAYLSKAKELANDRESIEALYELFQSNVDHSTIKKCELSKMNPAQVLLHSKLLKSSNWEYYALIFFVPQKFRPS